MSFFRYGVLLPSAPVAWIAGVALLGFAPVALASVAKSESDPAARSALTTTWSGRVVAPDGFVENPLPASPAALQHNTPDADPAPLPFSNVSNTDLLLGGGIPTAYHPATQLEPSEDTAATALKKPKVEESLLVPVPAIGAGWALILGAGMYQIGARALRLRR